MPRSTVWVVRCPGNAPPIRREVVYGAHWKFSETPPQIRRASPLIGMDNQYVFREVLGMSEAEIATLEARKVIY